MRRITATIIGIFALIIILLIRTQATRIPVPMWLFNLVTILMIILIGMRIARTWARGF